MRVQARFAIVLGTYFALLLSDVFALDPSLDITQYAHTSWRVRDGFVPSAINAIAQTPDGYLWLGTDSGLYHFDGIRTVAWQPPGGEQLPGNRVSGLLVARDGTLWISTVKGLASWKDGKLTHYPELAGHFLYPMLQDRAGTIWVGSLQPGSLCAVRAGNIQCYGDDGLGAVVTLYEDRNGYLWVGASTGLWRWDAKRPQHYPLTGVEISGIVESDDRRILLATSDGLKQLLDGRIRSYTVPGGILHFRPLHFFRSSDGSLWITAQTSWTTGSTTSSEGVLRLHQGRIDTFGTADGLSGEIVSQIVEDREGSIWLGGANGLDRLREYAIPTLSRNQGLSTSQTWAVQATSDGSVWISSPNGLNQWQKGHVTVFGSHTAPGQVAKPARYSDGGLAGTPRALGLDDQARLWAATQNGMFYFDGKHFVRVFSAPGGDIWSIAGDGHGKIWINNASVGLYYFAPGEPSPPIPWSQFGQKGFGPGALLPDRSHGGVWLGFNETGVTYFRNGEVRASYTTANGLGGGRVNDLRLDGSGTLWAATEGGLSGIRNAHIVTLASKNGLPCDAVHWSTEDDEHFVWLFQPCGLVRIARSEIDSWLTDPNRTVQATVFDASEGVKTLGSYGGYGPHMTKTPDGKIWFQVHDGESVINPHHLPFNKIPPPVHIEKITADDKTVDVSNGMHLPSGVRHLDIDYTALSLVIPEKVRFRVKLEGEDNDWRELVNVRHVEYTNLPPKHYTFRVLACNNSGVWNEEGASLEFVIPPMWYQTNWFFALCAAAFLAMLWAAYQLRMRQVSARFNMRLEERVSERTRIARELHDTLLQSFHGLLLQFQATSQLLQPNSPVKQRLDTAIDQAANAIAESRKTVQGLRTSTVEGRDLGKAIRTVGEELASANAGVEAIAFQVQGMGPRRDLRALVHDEVYRIAVEALRNAFQHAGAKRITVEIDYEPREFRLRISDDGRGIDSHVLQGEGVRGHFGLPGMRERATIIGGTLDVWSSLGEGTEINLTIPGTKAYSGADERPWWSGKLRKEKDESKAAKTTQ